MRCIGEDEYLTLDNFVKIHKIGSFIKLHRKYNTITFNTRTLFVYYQLLVITNQELQREFTKLHEDTCIDKFQTHVPRYNTLSVRVGHFTYILITHTKISSFCWHLARLRESRLRWEETLTIGCSDVVSEYHQSRCDTSRHKYIHYTSWLWLNYHETLKATRSVLVEFERKLKTRCSLQALTVVIFLFFIYFKQMFSHVAIDISTNWFTYLCQTKVFFLHVLCM